ncbi:hypothetical protein AOLI_G00252140 [Acnodon oligacanthus]
MASSANNGEGTSENSEGISKSQLVSERTKQRISLKEDIFLLIQESLGPSQTSGNALRETVDSFQSRLATTESTGENFEKLVVAEEVLGHGNLAPRNAGLQNSVPLQLRGCAALSDGCLKSGRLVKAVGLNHGAPPRGSADGRHLEHSAALQAAQSLRV